MNQAGQASTEYLITTGFLLVIIAIIFAYASVIYTETVTTNMASQAADTLATGIDQVRALGPNASVFVEVRVPANVLDFNIQNKDNNLQTISAVVFRLKTSAGTTQIARNTRGRALTDPITKCILAKEGRPIAKIFWSTYAPAVCIDDGTGNCRISC